MFNWFPLITVKRHREIVASKDKTILDQGVRLIAARKELSTLRAQLPKRGEGGQFVGKAGV